MAQKHTLLDQVKPMFHFPVFAAHSVHDSSAKIDGIIEMLTDHCEVGSAFIISEQVKHSEVPLEINVPVDKSLLENEEDAPKSNPQFERMVEAALRFFEEKM